METIWINKSIDSSLQEPINNFSYLPSVRVRKRYLFVSVGLEQTKKQYKDRKWTYKFEGKIITITKGEVLTLNQGSEKVNDWVR